VSEFPSDQSLVSRDQLVSILKRLARIELNSRRELNIEEEPTKLSTILDEIAEGLAYKNWSLFSKDVFATSEAHFNELRSKILESPECQDFIRRQSIDENEATLEMHGYVKRTFKPLVEFAFHDSESENGYAWPEVDLTTALEEEFGHLYPHDLIHTVAIDLEVDQGPWGEEDYGSE